MREIKFRAWYKGDKFPVDENDLADYEKPQMIYGVQNLYDGMGTEHKGTMWGIGSFGGLIDDDDFVVMQYTGLKDKNGKEIYEGDILYAEGNLGGEDYIGIVEYDDNQAKYIVKTNRGIMKWIPNEETWIKGNIYENPELLEV